MAWGTPIAHVDLDPGRASLIAGFLGRVSGSSTTISRYAAGNSSEHPIVINRRHSAFRLRISIGKPTTFDSRHCRDSPQLRTSQGVSQRALDGAPQMNQTLRPTPRVVAICDGVHASPANRFGYGRHHQGTRSETRFNGALCFRECKPGPQLV